MIEVGTRTGTATTNAGASDPAASPTGRNPPSPTDVEGLPTGTAVAEITRVLPKRVSTNFFRLITSSYSSLSSVALAKEKRSLVRMYGVGSLVRV